MCELFGQMLNLILYFRNKNLEAILLFVVHCDFKVLKISLSFGCYLLWF
jgi:hypothetical protein